mgnify:CR=1 FL=1
MDTTISLDGRDDDRGRRLLELGGLALALAGGGALLYGLAGPPHPPAELPTWGAVVATLRSSEVPIEAFAYAFDRQTYCARVRNVDCVPTLSWVPPGVPGHIETDAYAFDPAKAKAALAASSYGSAAKLPEITYTYISDDPAETLTLTE